MTADTKYNTLIPIIACIFVHNISIVLRNIYIYIIAYDIYMLIGI